MSVAPQLAIEEFCETGSGGTPSRANKQYYGGCIPWVKSGELREGVILDTEERITELGLNESSAKIIPSGSILLAMYGATVGRMAFLGVDAATNQAVCNIRPDPRKADARYVFHGLQSKIEHFLRLAAGGAQPNISQGVIRQTKLPLPPLGEQRRIAAILDKADALRRKRKRALDLLEELTASLVAKYLSSSKMAELGKIIRDGPTNGLYKPSNAYGGGAPIIRINNFYDGRIANIHLLRRLHLKEAELARFQVAEGDILINRVNSLEYLGKSAIVPALLEPTVYKSNMMRFSLDRSIMLPEVCVALLQTIEIKRQILSKAKNAVNQSSINQQDALSLILPLPSMNNQVKFLAAVKVIAALEATTSAHEASISVLFSSLQDRAFSDRL